MRFGAGTTRVVVRCEAQDGAHELAVGFTPGEPKRMRVDGAVVERLLDAPARPLVSVFLPDRLELVKGAPTLRRAHLDQLVTALWPARAGTRRAYAQTLAQRNALLTRIRAGQASQLGAGELGSAARPPWHRADGRPRPGRAERSPRPTARSPQELGLEGGAAVSLPPALARHRARRTWPRSWPSAGRATSSAGSPVTAPTATIVVLQRAERDLRAYGSQGQQRLGLLTLLLAERDAIAAARDSAPLMLLDDVMSELDHMRREALVALLRDGPGQSVITTTDLEHVPGAAGFDVRRVAVDAGRILTAAAV